MIPSLNRVLRILAVGVNLIFRLRADSDAVQDLIEGYLDHINVLVVMRTPSFDMMAIASMALCVFIVLCEVFWSPRELNQSNTTRLSDILKAEVKILVIAFLSKDRD